MFLVKDKSDEREKRIRELFESDPPLGMLLAAIHFDLRDNHFLPT